MLVGTPCLLARLTASELACTHLREVIIEYEDPISHIICHYDLYEQSYQVLTITIMYRKNKVEERNKYQIV